MGQFCGGAAGTLPSLLVLGEDDNDEEDDIVEVVDADDDDFDDDDNDDGYDDDDINAPPMSLSPSAYDNAMYYLGCQFSMIM